MSSDPDQRIWGLETARDTRSEEPNFNMHVRVQVIDLARMLFEGICTKALLHSHKEAMKGLERQQFSKPPKAPVVAGKKPAIAFGCVGTCRVVGSAERPTLCPLALRLWLKPCLCSASAWLACCSLLAAHVGN